MNVMEGRYWSKNGSKRMTSSSGSKNAVQQAYWPTYIGATSVPAYFQDVYELTFIGPAADEDFVLYIQRTTQVGELGAVVVSNGLSETNATFWMGIVVANDVV